MSDEQILQNVFKKFKDPVDIQNFLNEVKYNPGDDTKSPLMVVKKKTANCAEGAVFAAAALKHLGYKPLIIEILAENDDDHLLAVFKQNNHWGAIAKSNTTALRFREPVYKSIRELVMSYYDFYFNTHGHKTFRSYSTVLNLNKFNKYNWQHTEKDIYPIIIKQLDKIKHYKVLKQNMLKTLRKADPHLIKFVFHGSLKKGLYKPKS